MRVALTGGTGVVGRAVLARLSAEGHTVRALSRRPAVDSADPATDIQWVRGGLADPDALRALVAGCDAVLHAAYVATDVPEEFVQANVVGTLQLLAGAAAAGARQFLYVSSLAVYGDAPGGLAGADRLPLDEDFPLWPDDFYGAHKLAMEKMVIAARGPMGLNVSAFRLGCVLGDYPDPERDPLRRFVAAARAVGAVREPFAGYVIAAIDAARILVDSLGDAQVAGRVFNTFDRWLDFAELAPRIDGGIPVESAPAPAPGIRNDRLAELLEARPGFAFATQREIERLLAAGA